MTFNSLTSFIDQGSYLNYTTNTFYPTAGRIMFAFIVVSNNDDTLDSVTGSQYTWEKVTSIQFTGDGGGGYGYSGLNLYWAYCDSGNSDTLSVQCPGSSNPNTCMISVFEIASSFGKNCFTPRQITSNKTNGTIFQTTFNASKLESNGAFTFVAAIDKLTTSTAPTSYSVLDTISGDTPFDCGARLGVIGSGTSGTNVQWGANDSSVEYGMITVEVWNPHTVTGTAYSSPMAY